MKPGDFEAEVHHVCADLEAMLIEKNKAYGDSALNPMRAFSKASAEEQILVRIDDKISRIVRGQPAGEDVIKDLLGYFVLLRILRMRAQHDRAVDAEP